MDIAIHSPDESVPVARRRRRRQLSRLLRPASAAPGLRPALHDPRRVRFQGQYVTQVQLAAHFAFGRWITPALPSEPAPLPLRRRQARMQLLGALWARPGCRGAGREWGCSCRGLVQRARSTKCPGSQATPHQSPIPAHTDARVCSPHTPVWPLRPAALFAPAARTRRPKHKQ
jgi:hypothetical protein